MQTGNFVGDMAGYLGAEDSELVDKALVEHAILTGVGDTQSSNSWVPMCGVVYN